MAEITISQFDTPAGKYSAVLTSRGLAMLLFPTNDPELCHAWAKRWEPGSAITNGADNPHLAQLQQELTNYFEGRLRNFAVPLDLHGTPFQIKVWNEVYKVGYAQLRSYREIANSIGNPTAVRAVGAANGANPVPIIVPCHRIIGSNGKLVGYGGGLDLKRRLLEIEGAMFPVA